MAWFFVDSEPVSDRYLIEGETARHISKSLRMSSGEKLTLVTPRRVQLSCEITGVSQDSVEVEILENKPCENEPKTEVTLYQALPKGDKMELIIQKCVELGVSRIVPVISARCISRPDEKSLRKKQARWQKIALEAAQQSRRGTIPTVESALSFARAVDESRKNELNIIFYELGGENLGEVLKSHPSKIGVFIGSEGGFEKGEVQKMLEIGGKAATLGKRILRAETAPLAALSIIMYENSELDFDTTVEKEFEYDRNNLRNEN